ncbi:MAG: hypothetical protein QOD32_925 [Pyrinomonadaceae bacterium]|jgi:hypothetical protein|nr:hypothetical protein [Pyrinomonadaceae bacterium]
MIKYSLTKYISLRRYMRYVVAALVIACAALTVTAWRSSALKDSDKVASKRQFHARVREGVGREVVLPASGSSFGQVHASVNSVANFIERRSGVQVSGATKNRLAAMEESALNGAQRRFTVSELSDAIAGITLDRLATLSDQDISRVDDRLRGFNAPHLPKNFSRDFKLPGGIVFIGTPPDKTEARLRAVRDQLATPSGDVFRGMTRKFVKERVQNRAQYLSEAIPEKFGNMWDTINDEERSTANGGITPLQAVLITYSLASDDYLSDNEAALEKRMRDAQKSLAKLTGQPYPSPDGHRAYGVNGYIFSSPLDIILDEQLVNRLLDRLEERRSA